MAAIALLASFAIMFIPKQVLFWGIGLGAAVLVYLFTHKLLGIFKELFIAIMYAMGVLLPSISVAQVEINTTHYLLIFHFVILALTNLLMFSWFDRNVDLQDKRDSFATISGERTTRIAVWVLVGVQVLLTLIQLRGGSYNRATILLCFMGILLSLIFIFRKSLARHDYYRFFGDAVFIVPILYLA